MCLLSGLGRLNFQISPPNFMYMWPHVWIGCHIDKTFCCKKICRRKQKYFLQYMFVVSNQTSRNVRKIVGCTPVKSISACPNHKPLVYGPNSILQAHSSNTIFSGRAANQHLYFCPLYADICRGFDTNAIENLGSASLIKNRFVTSWKTSEQ